MRNQFNPDLVIVSAGYDSALGCPDGGMEVTPACFAHLCAPLMTLAGGRVAVVLEGGYCLQSLAEGAALTLRTLLGDPCPVLVDPIGRVSATIRAAILNCTYVLRPFWRSMQTHRTYNPHELPLAIVGRTSGGGDAGATCVCRADSVCSCCAGTAVASTPIALATTIVDDDDRHRVVQRFDFKGPMPTRHPTRNWHFRQPEHVQRQLAERLTSLTLRTDLRMAHGGVGFLYEAASDAMG